MGFPMHRAVNAGLSAALGFLICTTSALGQDEQLRSAFKSFHPAQIERALASNLRNIVSGLETIEESDTFALYLRSCGNFLVNIQKKFRGLDAIKSEIDENLSSSWHHLSGLPCGEEKARSSSYKVYYFGQPIGVYHPDRKFVVEAGDDWKKDELPDEINFSGYFDGLNPKGTGPVAETNMMKALALGSAAAGLSLFWDFKARGYSTDGLSLDNKAQKTAFLAYALSRKYLPAVEYKQYLDQKDLALALDWVRQNPGVNPMEATFPAFEDTMSSKLQEELALPTGAELLNALNNYLKTRCSYEGLLAHARLQRGDQPIPNPATAYKATPRGCSMGTAIVTLELYASSLERKKCDADSVGGMDCAITFRWGCQPSGVVCDEVSRSPNHASLKVAKTAIGSWTATALVYDGTYRAPKEAPRTSDPHDLFSPENLPATLLFLE